jgi:hypothetical protein
MKTNELEIKQKLSKNGKSYDNISLELMDDGDIITVKKLDDVVTRTEMPDANKPGKTWVGCRTNLEYKGKKVGLYLPKGWTSHGYVGAETYADMFDKTGSAGSTIEISVKTGAGRDSKGKPTVLREYFFKEIV